MTISLQISSTRARQPLLLPTGPRLIARENEILKPLVPVTPDGDTPEATSQMRRTRIWEFGTNLHCSIIGTCLSTADLRHILIKLGVAQADQISPHELHNTGVMLASRRENGAKLIQKALDRQHRVAITRYGKAKDAEALVALWEESLKLGDVPGAYWALLTHPATTEDLVKRVFGDIHMLSHLVGAANRADIRRLRQLEQENAALTAKVERQQRQLHEGFAARDEAIRRLNDMLARRMSELPERHEAALPARPRPRQQTTSFATSSASSLTRPPVPTVWSVATMPRRPACKKASATRKSYERRLDAARRELEALEAHFDGLLGETQPAPRAHLGLNGLTLLYVGGRTSQIPRLRALVERAGGRFLHHDGGIEHSQHCYPA